jgi:hypothetical protein
MPHRHAASSSWLRRRADAQGRRGTRRRHICASHLTQARAGNDQACPSGVRVAQWPRLPSTQPKRAGKFGTVLDRLERRLRGYGLSFETYDRECVLVTIVNTTAYALKGTIQAFTIPTTRPLVRHCHARWQLAPPTRSPLRRESHRTRASSSNVHIGTGAPRRYAGLCGPYRRTAPRCP